MQLETDKHNVGVGVGHAVHYLLVTSQNVHLAAANCSTWKQLLSKKAQSKTDSAGTHRFGFFPPFTNTLSAACVCSYTPAAPRAGACSAAAAAASSSQSGWDPEAALAPLIKVWMRGWDRRARCAYLCFVIVIVTQCHLSLSLFWIRKCP